MAVTLTNQCTEPLRELMFARKGYFRWKLAIQSISHDGEQAKVIYSTKGILGKTITLQPKEIASINTSVAKLVGWQGALDETSTAVSKEGILTYNAKRNQ